MIVDCAKCKEPIGTMGANIIQKKRRGEMVYSHRVCPKRNRRTTKKAKRRKLGRLSRLEWNVRKGEVFLRDKGCQYYTLRFTNPNLPPDAIGCEGILDVHHIVHRSKGGTDALDNLTLLCRRHHNMMHPEKRLRWSKRG